MNRPITTTALTAGLLAFAAPDTALAGPPPGGGLGGGPGGPGLQPGGPPGQKDDDKGPAEAAPKDKKTLEPIVEIPAQPARSRRLQLFEMHGYFRTRVDYFNNLSLSILDSALGQSTPFFTPPTEASETRPDGTTEANQVNCLSRKLNNNVSGSRAFQRCSSAKPAFSSANLRLRLQPTLHVTDTVNVHATVDALDNVVLGSTPEIASAYAPYHLYSRTQNPPGSGVDSVTDSVVVKRAYGHIHFGWGLDLKFGRMPQHWGMGIVYNDGNGYDRREMADIARMLDTDYGDSVDSVRLAYDFGKDKRNSHQLAASYDWAASGLTTPQLLGPEWSNGNLVGQEFSVERFDNVHQLSISILRQDTPDMRKRKLSLNVPVFNYGFKNWLRMQNVDRAFDAEDLQILDLNAADDEDLFQEYANQLVHRRAILWTPDLWFRTDWKTMRIELEAAMNLGRFYHRPNLDEGPESAEFDLDAAEATQETIIASFGYALEFKYGLFQDRFHIGFDQGFASGDSAPPAGGDPRNPLTVTTNAAGDLGSLNNFRFNPAYAQDLLLFREINGTVANAAYFRPWAAFHFFKNNASVRLDINYAMAHQRTATPGDKLSYGLEIDGALRYHDTREPIFAQFQYGVMFPFGAFETINADFSRADPRAAQTVQAQVGIKF